MSARAIKPPPLPIEILERVIRVSSVDGRLVLWLSAFYAILCAGSQYALGAIAGVAAAGAGALEMHASTLLRRGNPAGMEFAIRGQLLLLGTILLYSAVRFYTLDATALRAQIPPDLQQQLEQGGVAVDQFVRTVAQLASLTIGFVALIYQGGMIRYYIKRRPAVEQALMEEENVEARSTNER